VAVDGPAPPPAYTPTASSTSAPAYLALDRTGDGTYSGAVSPFLAGLQSPVPVVTTGDGALLVGDWATGTVYRITAAA
jgi:glucose/arabinose dehydrogenase